MTDSGLAKHLVHAWMVFFVYKDDETIQIQNWDGTYFLLIVASPKKL